MKTFKIKIHYIFLLALALLGFGNAAKAQTTVQIGTGTSSQTSSPVYTFDKYSVSEILYLGTEINTTGNITSLGFEKLAGNTTAIPNVSIYMKTVSNTVVSTTSTLTGYTLVWSGSFPNTASGWQNITLTTPFAFTSNSDNVSIIIVNNSGASVDTPRPSWSYTSTSSNYRASYWYGSSNTWTSASTMTRMYTRPNIKVTVSPATPCSGTPAPGNTVASGTSVCPGSSFTLSLQNTTTGSGITYQWQSSANGNTWANISGAISSTLTTSQTAAAYYRCNVTCSGSTGTSNALQVTMANTIPFFEGFENGQANSAAVSGCWSQQSISGSAVWTANSTLTDHNRTPRTGSFNAYLQYSNEDWLFYALPLTGGVAYDMEFYARQDVTSGATITAAYGTSASSSAMINTIVAGTAVTNGTYQKFSGTFTPVTSGTYYVGIKATLSFTPYYISLDDIKITVATGCVVPSGITATNITTSSATVSWNTPATAPANGYEYYRATSSTAPTDTTAATGTTAAGITTTPIQGLSANTLYYVWMRSVCSSTDKSAWVGTTFTTACGAINAPYTQNFDSASTLPGCTAVQNVNNDSYTWAVQTSSSYANSGSNSLRYTTGTTAANDWWFTPGINVTAGATYKITFAYRAFTSSYPEALEVKTGTAQNADGMQGTAIFSNSNITSALFTTATVYYNATASGVQYFGWHATTTSSGFYLCIDDISITALPDCSAITLPATIAAQASASSVCSSEALTFGLSATMPESSGITYQWKSSADGNTYANAGAAITSATATLTANESARWFKCDVLCNGNVVLTSSPVQIGINVSILSVTPASRCGLGTVQLNATSQSGNTAKWYDSATGITALGTGLSFTTPPIAHSTTFYAAAMGQQTLFSTGITNPGIPGNLGSTNNAVETYFTVTTATSLSSVTIYPLDAGTNNKIILKNGSGTVLQEYTFTITTAEANSSGTSMGSPKVVPLNWSLPAGDYKLQWDNPGGASANRVLRNLGGAAAYYGTNNQGVTFTGNSGSGTAYWFYFYDWKFITGCGESAIRVPVTATVNYEWTGAADNNWNNPANWCGGTLPEITDDITIPQMAIQPVVDNNSVAYAKSLAVANNTNVTVKPGSTLWVANSLTVADNATLTIENNGALVQVNNAANTGKIVVHKNSNPLYRLDYTMWSSPVEGQNLAAFSPATSTNRFYEYRYGVNSSNNYVEGYWPVTPGDHSFETAKGYLIRMPNSNAAQNYNAGTASLVFDGIFTGKPNNGTLNIALSIANNRYTAVGNPYPSPVSVAAFFAENSTKLQSSTGIYLWRKRNNAESSSYATVSLAGYVANTDDTTTGSTGIGSFYTGDKTLWTLAPGQGFIVKTAPGLSNPLLTFTNSMRRATPGATQGFFKSAPGTDSKLWLNIKAQDGSTNQALVAYMDEATSQIDYGYDAQKLTDGNTVSLYSIAENTPLSIQARPDFMATDVVPMGFTAPASGNYTISLDHTEGIFSQGQYIYLKDKTEGIVRNLSLNNYIFTTVAGTFDNRFEIMYANTALGTDNPVLNADTVVVYKQDGSIIINTGNTLINGIAVYDIRGRQLYKQQDINSAQTAINALHIANEVLIIEIDTVKGKVAKRIVF